jgi:ribonuclease BN (tRNA processing enzyme)
MACADRNHSAYLYRLGETTLLLDCGEPLSRNYKASALGYEIIDRIFISHLHADHVGGFFMLLQGFWLEQRKKPLHVHLPGDGVEPIRQMLRAGFLFDEVLPFQLVFEPLQAGRTVTHAGIRVTPFRTSHLDGFRRSFQTRYPGDYDAFSFLIETDRLRIGHTADLGAVSDLEPLVAKPLDLLTCELAHFKAEELFEYLKVRDIKHVLFMHLGRPYWEKLEQVRKLAAQMLPNFRLSFPRDLEVVSL